MTVTINGTGLINFNSNGDVGINTSTPSSPGGAKNLVVDSSGITIIKSTTSNNTTGSARFDLATGTGNSYAIIGLNDNTGSPYWQLSAGSTVTGAYYDMPQHIFRNVAGTERMRIDSSGRVTKPYQPFFLASSSSGTHTTNVNTVLDFNQTLYNVGGHYNTSTYAFTAPIAGYYFLHLHLYQQNGANQTSVAFRKNNAEFTVWDTAILYKAGGVNADTTWTASFIMQLAANDTASVAVRSLASTNLSWYGGHSWFMGYLLG